MARSLKAHGHVTRMRRTQSMPESIRDSLLIRRAAVATRSPRARLARTSRQLGPKTSLSAAKRAFCSRPARPAACQSRRAVTDPRQDSTVVRECGAPGRACPEARSCRGGTGRALPLRWPWPRAGHDSADGAPCGGVASLAAESHAVNRDRLARTAEARYNEKPFCRHRLFGLTYSFGHCKISRLSLWRDTRVAKGIRL